MLKFYKDRKQIFECKVKIEGADAKNATTRLVLKNGSISHTFDGELDVLGNCRVEIPPLDEFNGDGGQAILEVRINDIIFEPYRTRFEVMKQEVKVVSEAKIIEKPKLYKEKADKKVVIKMLETFNKLPKKHKKTLKEYIEYSYQPSPDAKRWSKTVFNDLNSLQAKIAMYELENIVGKK